jgi:hypothetical protein
LERYVTRYQKDLPLLLDAYKGQNSDWSYGYVLYFEDIY